MDRREFGMTLASIPVAPMIPRQELELQKKEEEVKKSTQYLRVWSIGDGVEVKKDDMQNLIKVISGVVKQSKSGGDIDMLIGGSVKCTAIPWGGGIDAVIGLSEDDEECKVAIHIFE